MVVDVGVVDCSLTTPSNAATLVVGALNSAEKKIGTRVFPSVEEASVITVCPAARPVIFARTSVCPTGMVRLAGETVATAVLATDSAMSWAIVSALERRIVNCRWTPSGGMASGAGALNTWGRTGLIVMVAVALPTELVKVKTCGPRAAVVETDRVKDTWVGVTDRFVMPRPGSLLVTVTLFKPLPVTCTRTVVPRLTAFGVTAVIVGACAVELVITCNRLPAAS